MHQIGAFIYSHVRAQYLSSPGSRASEPIDLEYDAIDEIGVAVAFADHFSGDLEVAAIRRRGCRHVNIVAGIRID